MASILTNTFDPTKKVLGRWAHLVYTPAGVSPTLVHIRARLCNLTADLKTVLSKSPDSIGVLRADGEQPLEADESFTLADIEEFETVVTALGGLTSMKTGGTAVLYLRQPDDASGKMRIATGSFKCSLKKPKGDVKLAGDDFAKTSIEVVNLSGAELTFSYAATDPQSA